MDHVPQASERVRFILVEPSHPGNIGSAARAVKTMGFTDLRVVNPKDPDFRTNPEAVAFATSSVDVLENARTHETLLDALEGVTQAFALSGYSREFGPPIEDLRTSAARAAAWLERDDKPCIAFVFGTERSGLTNEQMDLCQTCSAIAANPESPSLNLSQAVQITAPAIVKGLKPIEDIADELRGADYLVWRNGRGAVRLLGRENNLMLLEYAGERMLSHIVAEHGDYQATEIAAELMAKLYAASEEPLPSALLPIRDRFAALFQRARDDQNAGCQTDYVHAAIIADQMMSNASELRGLHGDLHHENIMFSSRGWLVIDPVGLVGEVGFGAANMFYDPADRDDLCLDPRRIAQMADAFSRALDVDPRRLLDQAYAYGCLSAAWNADGEEEQRDLAIAAAIKQVRQTSY